MSRIRLAADVHRTQVRREVTVAANSQFIRRSSLQSRQSLSTIAVIQRELRAERGQAIELNDGVGGKSLRKVVAQFYGLLGIPGNGKCQSGRVLHVAPIR